MKVSGLSVLGFVVVAAVVAAIAVSRKADPPVDQSARAEVETDSVARNMPDANVNLRPEVKPSQVSKASAEELTEAGDYFSLVKGRLAAAESGDVDAQFNVWKAMSYCDENVRFYFVRAGRRLSLEEGLGWAIKRNLPYATAQRVYDRCHGFIESGTAIDAAVTTRWLNAAAEQGHSVAQSVLAEKLLQQQMLRGFEGASGAQNSHDDVDDLGLTKSPVELLQAAVKSRDPEVLFRIGDMMSLLNPTAPDVSVQRLSWIAVACERGLDCSSQADWVAASCLTAECSSINNNTEVVRILAGNRWSEVQQRARQLSDSLDAGRWEDLGLNAADIRG